MDFLVYKFSEWLKNSGLAHDLVKVKGGYILNFINPSEDLKKLISSLFITIDSSEEKNHLAVRKPVNIFTANGDGIVIEEKYCGEILSTIQPVLFEYIQSHR